MQGATNHREITHPKGLVVGTKNQEKRFFVTRDTGEQPFCRKKMSFRGTTSAGRYLFGVEEHQEDVF
jgi:hypothetical protein